MNVRRVEPGRGWDWMVEGFALFRRNPVVWVTMTVVLAVIWVITAMLPFIGAIALNLVGPVFLAGLVLGCQALERGEDLEIAHLFAGFRGDVAPLLVVGLVHAVGALLIFGAALLVAGGTMLPAILSGRGLDPQLLMSAVGGVLIGLAVALLLYTPLLMAVWFAPVLVLLKKLPPVEAMKLSFEACRVNVLPGLVYGVVVIAAWIAAVIPLMLGLLVLMPVLGCSIYTSYKDLFEETAAAPAPRNRLLD